MISADRQKLILEYLRQKETVLSSALAKEFGVTLMTIGRDLKQLEEKGLLVRTHGGAMLPGFMEAETSYAKKKSRAIDVKRRLAAAALPFLHPGMTLFLDAGTTTYEIAEQLVSEKLNDLTVITNDLRIALLLYPSKEPRTIMLGGRILREMGGVAGALAAEELASLLLMTSRGQMFRGACEEAGAFCLQPVFAARRAGSGCAVLFDGLEGRDAAGGLPPRLRCVHVLGERHGFL